MPTSLIVVHDSVEMALGTYSAEPPLPPDLMAAAHDSVTNATSCGIGVEARDRLTRAFVQFLAPPSNKFPGADVHLADPHLLRTILDLQKCHAAVVMSHHLPSDTIYLRELAQADAPDYVWLLGPSARRHRLADASGSSADRLRSRLRGPVGLDIGAVTPEGIALSIVSPIHAWLTGRDAPFLKVSIL
jgi:xanthine/CO dehydrogenase XdhC/CoxF family maturation factor